MKNKVPDWLNSSLWSSAPPPPDRISRYDSQSITVDAPPQATEPPVPVPPPSVVREEPPNPQVVSPSNSRVDDEIVRSERPSAEETSRQSMLLAEVRAFYWLLCELIGGENSIHVFIVTSIGKFYFWMQLITHIL